MFDAGKTRMIGLPYGEKNYVDMLSRFHLVPERNGQTDGQTDRQTDLLYQYRASVCCMTRDKNGTEKHKHTNTQRTDRQTEKMQLTIDNNHNN